MKNKMKRVSILTMITALTLSVVLFSSAISQEIFALTTPEVNPSIELNQRVQTENEKDSDHHEDNGNGDAENDKIISADKANDLIKKNHPAELSKSQLDNVKNIALSDAGVQQIINGKPFEFMSQGFLGNIKEKPVVWNPTININVNNQTDMAVEVNLTNNSVITVSEAELTKSALAKAAFASDYFTGSAVISGIFSTQTAPAHNLSPNVRFLTNGLESGGSGDAACNSANEFNNWFGQAGFDFKNGIVMYTDTSFNCVNQNALVAYSPGHPYLFEVYSISGFKWDIVDLDQQTGLSNLYTTSFTTAANTLQTSNINTSVWFENQETSTNWAGDFTTSINANNAKYRDSSTGTWTLWNSDSQVVWDCNGFPETQNVMNNNLKSGNAQTWNLVNFEVWHC